MILANTAAHFQVAPRITSRARLHGTPPIMAIPRQAPDDGSASISSVKSHLYLKSKKSTQVALEEMDSFLHRE